MQIEFIWDERKNAANQRKHGISFEEAKTCFEDEHARVFFDAEHSAQEDKCPKGYEKGIPVLLE